MPPQISSVEYHPSDEGSQHRARPVGLLATSVILAVAALVLAAMVYTRETAVTGLRTQLNQANTEMARMKADLASATAKSGDLQGQVDRMGAQQADLQAQLRKDQALRTDLQSQVRKAQADLTAQQEKARTQQADLQAAQSQLDQAKASSADLQKQVDQAKSQTEDLKTQLAQAQSQAAKPQAAAAAARALPVATSFKKGFFSHLYTLEVKNSGSDPLPVDIKVTGSPKAASRSATIAAGHSLEIGKLDAGGRVEITSGDFMPVDLMVR